LQCGFVEPVQIILLSSYEGDEHWVGDVFFWVQEKFFQFSKFDFQIFSQRHSISSGQPNLQLSTLCIARQHSGTCEIIKNHKRCYEIFSVTCHLFFINKQQFFMFEAHFNGSLIYRTLREFVDQAYSSVIKE